VLLLFYLVFCVSCAHAVLIQSEFLSTTSCVLTYATGRRYTGEVRRGRPHGKGREVEPLDAASYDGDWVAGQYHGHGLVFNADGSRYEGQFAQGERNGQGEYAFADGGGKYTGAWVGGSPHGHGSWQYEDGSHYKGEFVEGSKHGHGTLTNADGTVQSGQWINDEFASVVTSTAAAAAAVTTASASSPTHSTVISHSVPPLSTNQKISLVKILCTNAHLCTCMYVHMFCLHVCMCTFIGNLCVRN
jgi:hypothetical protein